MNARKHILAVDKAMGFDEGALLQPLRVGDFVFADSETVFMQVVHRAPSRFKVARVPFAGDDIAITLQCQS